MATLHQSQPKKAKIFNKTFAKINKSSKRTRLDKALWSLFKKQQKKRKSPIAVFEEELLQTVANVEFTNKDVMKPNKLQKL